MRWKRRTFFDGHGNLCLRSLVDCADCPACLGLQLVGGILRVDTGITGAVVFEDARYATQYVAAQCHREGRCRKCFHITLTGERHALISKAQRQLVHIDIGAIGFPIREPGAGNGQYPVAMVVARRLQSGRVYDVAHSYVNGVVIGCCQSSSPKQPVNVYGQGVRCQTVGEQQGIDFSLSGGAHGDD